MAPLRQRVHRRTAGLPGYVLERGTAHYRQCRLTERLTSQDEQHATHAQASLARTPADSVQGRQRSHSQTSQADRNHSTPLRITLTPSSIRQRDRTHSDQAGAGVCIYALAMGHRDGSLATTWRLPRSQACYLEISVTARRPETGNTASMVRVYAHDVLAVC